jgi:predicted ATPase
MLHLKNVGPAPEMKLEFAPRLNVITGDNGLGKSFILDCVRKKHRSFRTKISNGWFGIRVEQLPFGVSQH